MFGRTTPPRPTIDALRAPPWTVGGSTAGTPQAAVTRAPAGGRRLSSPLLLLGHPGGWDRFRVDEVVDPDARRAMSASPEQDHRTCLRDPR